MGFTFKLKAALAEFLSNCGLAWDSTIDYKRQKAYWTWYWIGKKRAKQAREFQKLLQPKLLPDSLHGEKEE